MCKHLGAAGAHEGVLRAVVPSDSGFTFACARNALCTTEEDTRPALLLFLRLLLFLLLLLASSL